MRPLRRIPGFGNRFIRIAVIVLLVLGGGTAAVVAAQPARHSGAGGGLLDAARALVGGGHAGNNRPVVAPRRLTEGAVPRADAPPAGKAWPAARRVRELPARRTANGTFYQLSDGRVQAEIAAAPVHYRDAHGAYQRIDTTVRPVHQAGFVAGNTTNSFTTLFGDSSARIVRLQSGGRTVDFGLPGPAHRILPRISGSTVTYPGAAGGADLVYDLTSRELKERVVVNRPAAAGFSVTFTASSSGVQPAAQPDGSIAFTGRDGGVPLLTIPAPYMDDASTAHSDRVTQRLSGGGSAATITVSADRDWLADPARHYPVTIDPTVRIQPVPTDGQDVEIYSGATTTNYNATYQLKVGTDATQSWRTLVQFPLTGVPSGVTIDDATLSMFYDQTQYAYGYDVSMEARKVTTAWTESTATWANMSANIAASPAGNSVTVDDTDTTKIAMSGTWPASTNTALTPYGINSTYRYNNDTTTGNTFTWIPALTQNGNYQVEVHFVRESDRPTNAPYTVYYSGGQKAYSVDQSGTAAGVWKTLGVHPFVAGTTGKVVLGDVAGKAVIADAVRLTKSAVDTKKAAISSAWNNFSVRDAVQSWITTPSSNHGLMVKAVDEATKGRGGPIYEASEYFYNNGARDYNLPKLTVTWGRPSVTVAQPTTVTATGAALSWSAYQDPSTATGDNIVEYQVHRSVHQAFTPSAATLVAPLTPGTTGYQDSSAKPTPADTPDTQLGQYYYYMVAVKTADGQVIASPTVGVRLPKAGRITQVYRTGTVDTTLSKTLSTTNVDVYDGDPYVSAGNNSSYYGVTRGLVKFPALTALPAGAQVTDAKLRMWNTYNYGATTGLVDAHRLTRGFTETTATWAKADATNAWTTPGGDYDPAVLDNVTGITNDPEWEVWDVTTAARTWLGTPASNYGLLLKMHDESVASQRVMLLASEGQEPLLRPTLEITYLQKTAASTYYAPDTPARMIPGDTYTIPVTLSNPTLTAWPASTWELSYHWTLPDGTDATTGGNQVATPLPKDIVSGDTVTVNATLKTPIQSDSGNKRTNYVLKWELHNKISGLWLSATDGIASLDQSVAVEDPTSDQLGLEKFYSYRGVNTGAGTSLANNLYAGNTVWTYSPVANPSRGLSTFLRLSYNSMDTDNTAAGFGWSLQASSLMRLGTPLDFHPNPHPTTVTLTDGDGTSHVFSWDATANDWASPAGVHLYLQQLVDCKPNTEESQAWVMTQPDRTQFFYDCEGYLSSIVDKNGNTMSFTYESRQSRNKPTKFLRYLTDPAGRTTLTIDYWAKGDTYDYIDDSTWTKVTGQSNLTNPFIIDQVKQITDISGRKLNFTYTVKGLLGQLIDGTGSSQPKVFGFVYDMTQGSKNVKLIKVVDPRGNTTNLTYYSNPTDDPKFKWWTKTYTDRLGNPTQFGYTDPDGTAGSFIQTAVTDAENHATTYLIDGYGRATQTTNAKNLITKLNWDADNNVTRLEQPNGGVSTWKFDPKTGYPTEVKDAEAVKNGWAGTTLTYQTGLNGHIADVIGKVSQQGNVFTFGYDTEGDLTSVTDPDGNATTTANDYTTSYTYDTWGQQQTVTDANGHTTTNSAFDDNGFPQTITDAKGNATKIVYDQRGQVTKSTDPLGHNTTQTYDTFNRPLVNVVPLDQTNGQVITTPAPVYDANDNVTSLTRPNGGVTTSNYDAADRLTFRLDPVDNAGDPERKTSYTYDKVGNVLTTTSPKGNLTTDPSDFVTTNRYDPVYLVTTSTDAAGGVTSYTYDTVGNVKTVADPRKSATPDTTDVTAAYDYDLNGRVTKTTDAAGTFTGTTYDKDGRVTATTDQNGSTTLITLDPRGKPTQVQTPHVNNAGTINYRTTQYVYDQVGNTTKVITPRGTATTGVADDFVNQTVYDELNRVAQQLSPYDPGDSRYNAPDITTYTYDAAGRLATLSAPPSAGQTIRNDTTYAYFDNGWTKQSTDPWDIRTSYLYNEMGQQTSRTVTSAGGSSSRTMSWQYNPIGSLKARADQGSPVGKQVVLVDNSDFNNAASTGTWTTGTTAAGLYGPSYATHAAGTGANTFTWNLKIPQSGSYEVFVHYPNVSGAATDAKFSIANAAGTTVKTVNQTTGSGTWVSLGSYTFNEGATHKVSLSDQATGTVVADTVKLVRDNSADVDNEKQDFTYSYDPNGNRTGITDNSPGTLVDTYAMSYTGLDQLAQVQEKLAGQLKNTTSFTYNVNGTAKTVSHDRQYSAYEYDVRDLLSKVTTGASATAANPHVTTYTYTNAGEPLRQGKANGNTVDFGYFLDGMLRTQTEKRADGTLVASHTVDYDPNGNRTSDAASVMNADNHAAYLNSTSTYGYDPRDRLKSVTTTGAGAGTETYVHDANSNVTSQTVKTITTDFNYDRNRLLISSTAGALTSYNYDPYGRLDTMTSGGTIIQRQIYDGFDHVVETRSTSGGTTKTTKYTFDPMDRTTSKTTDAGTAKQKITAFSYLGLSGQVLDEKVAGVITKTYEYSGTGERLAQVTHNTDGTDESAFYGYNAHNDTETLTGSTGDTLATYGYTAFGQDNTNLFTGRDKPDPQNPDKEPYNSYRFNAKRVDTATGSYDMGFRDYSPSLNRFLTRDSYNGALADLGLGASPWTGNRYAFGGGNPINSIEVDGHCGWNPTTWGDCASDAWNATTSWIGDRAEDVKDLGSQLWEGAKEAWHDVKETGKKAWDETKKAATATKNWAVKHADIVGTVAGVVVGLGCTAITGGAGAIACGALGGLVTGLTTGALQCAGGDQSHCGMRNMLLDAAVGAGLGALGGAAGALLGGAGAGMLSGLRGGLSAIGKGAVSGFTKAAGELIPGTAAAVRAFAPRALGNFLSGSGRNIAREYAEKGLVGQLRAVGGDLARGAVSSSGLSSAAVGGLFPSTRDDLVSYASGDASFGVSNLINTFGGALGGGFE